MIRLLLRGVHTQHTLIIRYKNKVVFFELDSVEMGRLDVDTLGDMLGLWVKER